VWGAIPAVAASATIERALGASVAALSGELAHLVGASFVAPPVEEFFKALGILIVFQQARHEFDDVLDGIVYGAMAGFGFAMTENIIYFFRARDTADVASWAIVVLGRSVAFGFNHAMFSSLAGVGCGLARYGRSRRQKAIWIGAGLGVAILAHAVHNFFLNAGNFCILSFLADWIGVVGVFVIVLVTWSREQAWLQAELEGEIQEGVLTQELYTFLLGPHRRWRAILRGYERRSERGRLYRRILQVGAELAIKKHQQSAMAGLEDHRAEIADLRGEILSLRRALGDDTAPELASCHTSGAPMAQMHTVCNCCAEDLPRDVEDGRIS
jgi:RsiW-degrading membrane proteinase PrsW (M82 family)